MASFKPADFPRLSPYLVAENAEEAIAFYKQVFQFTEHSKPVLSDNGKVMHATLSLGEAAIMLAPEGAYGNPKLSPKTTQSLCPIGLYLYVEDVDQYFEHAKQQGALVLDPPTDTFWGDRMCRLQDNNNYDWSFATTI